MKEYFFPELGNFTKMSIEGITKAMQGKTYMRFEITSSNYAGNRTLIVRTDYDAPKDEIKRVFLHAALGTLAILAMEKED